VCGLSPIVVVAALTGARRNEVLALQWRDLDLEKKTLRIERAVEQVHGHPLVLKEPKTARGKRTITIDDGLLALLRDEREKHLRIRAGVPDDVAVDLSLLRLPDDALMFPNQPAPGEDFSFTKLRNPDNTTKEFVRRARKLGFANLRLHDLRGTHETLQRDAGVPVHVVAARCGHDPAVLLRSYAKRTKKADTSAAAVIGASRATSSRSRLISRLWSKSSTGTPLSNADLIFKFMISRRAFGSSLGPTAALLPKGSHSGYR
jgi:integrase